VKEYVLHIRHFQFYNKEKRDPGVPFEFKSNAISLVKPNKICVIILVIYYALLLETAQQ
jgi:hypothetical protein